MDWDSIRELDGLTINLKVENGCQMWYETENKINKVKHKGKINFGNKE